MSAPDPSPKNRKGFSLILSLTMMTMIVFVVIVLAAFLSVESRAAATFQLATRARLNALMAGRLAVAHLQQAAGPDRRSTATGDLAGVFNPPNPYATTLSNSEKISQGQRNWTGVWRTDKSNEPPAWLISGKGDQNLTSASTEYTVQSKSLSGLSDYPVTNLYWLPWAIDYPATASKFPSYFAVLVGNGSATLEPGTDSKYGTSDDVDGRIALPKIPLPGVILGTSLGSYAYWIGDEGVKARINLRDTRDFTQTVPASADMVNALRTPVRMGTELLTGLTAVGANQADLNQVSSPLQLSLVSGYTATTNGLESRKLSFHNQSLWSAGVLADSYHGGLKRDLSLAFEMDDYDFDNSDFGSGATEKWTTVTEQYNSGSEFTKAAGNLKTDGVIDPVPRVWVPMYEKGNNNPKRELTTGATYLPFSPVFMRQDLVASKRFVGPLWHVVRDYYRLYKEIDWTNDVATLPARSFFPNNYQFFKGAYSNGSYRGTGSGASGLPQYDPFEYESSYSVGPFGYPSVNRSGGGSVGLGKLYPGANHQGDPLGFINPQIGKNSPTPPAIPPTAFIPRVVRSAYMPNIHRVSMILSVKKSLSSETSPESSINPETGLAFPLYNIYLVCTPVVIIHNPYNVKLTLQSSKQETNSNTIGKAMTLAISGLEQVYVDYPDHTRTTTWLKSYRTADNLITGRYLRTIFNFRRAANSGDDKTNGEYESLLVTIPEITLEPGEFAVFSSKKLLDNNSTTHGSNYGNTFEGGKFNQQGNAELNRADDGSNLSILPLEKGFWYTGGFSGMIPWSSTDLGNVNWRAACFFADEKFNCSIKIGSAKNYYGYWKCWTSIISGWKGNKAGDIDKINVDESLNPGFSEILGTSKFSSKASSGQTIYVGNYGTNTDRLFYGDAGAYPGANVIVKSRVDSLVDINTVSPGDVCGVVDTRFRVADTKRDTPYDRTTQGLSPTAVPAPYPAWIFSNPLSVSSSNAPLGGLPAIGNASLRTQIYGGDQLNLIGGAANWSNILVNDFSFADGTRALGGISHEAQGSNSITEIEIPQSPPLSIGQLMHANVSVSDLFPYRTIGNSFPNTVVPLDKSWTYSTPYTVTQYTGGSTFADMSYLMNNALWDSFFFSGAAPVLKSSKSGNYNAVRGTKAQDVLNNFAAGTGKLANPSMRLYQSLSMNDAVNAFGFTGDGTGPAFLNTADRNVTTQSPDGWKKMAAYLLNDGAFNVNSTSVEAWTALYSSLRGIGIGKVTSNKTNTPFPRIIGASGQDITGSDLKSSNYWNGFINLSDTQIKALAVATVAEIKARAKFFYRTERDQETATTTKPLQELTPTRRLFLGFAANPNQEPSTPFLGMCEFINRFLGPTKKPVADVSLSANIADSLYPLPTSSTTNTGAAYSVTFPAPASSAAACPDKYKWMVRSGTMESAIARAGLAATPTNGATIDPAVSYNWKYDGGTNGGRTGMPPGLFWRNTEILNPETNDNRTHNGFGANGCLFQGDLLQSLGPRLATRSDTFTIRAYGEANDDSGASASYVIELVLQRTPEYIDNNAQPHERLEDMTTAKTLNAKNINTVLGRRFIIVSAHWLAKSEI